MSVNDGAANDLHRLAVLDREAGAQRLVAANHFVERALERTDVELAAQPDWPREVVRDVARRKLVDEPELLLHERAPWRTGYGANGDRSLPDRDRRPVSVARDRAVPSGVAETDHAQPGEGTAGRRVRSRRSLTD